MTYYLNTPFSLNVLMLSYSCFRAPPYRYLLSNQNKNNTNEVIFKGEVKRRESPYGQNAPRRESPYG